MAARLIQDTKTTSGTIAEARRVAPLHGTALRERAQLTLAEVGRQVGTSAQTISNWERGLCKPTEGHAADYLALLRELQRLTEPVCA